MSLPVDRESLLAAWDAICPSQPLPDEVHGVLLAYFRHANLQGDHTVGWLAPPAQQIDQLSPPSRFVRQPRGSTKAPLGPAEAATYTSREEALSSTLIFPMKSDSVVCNGNSTAVGQKESDDQ